MTVINSRFVPVKFIGKSLSDVFGIRTCEAEKTGKPCGSHQPTRITDGGATRLVASTCDTV